MKPARERKPSDPLATEHALQAAVLQVLTGEIDGDIPRRAAAQYLALCRESAHRLRSAA
jgi:hypothetical protein